MFGKDNIVKVIKKGDLDGLKKILEKDPDAVKETFRWKVKTWHGSILDVAAYYNQAALLEFLVADKGVDVNKRSFNDWTALHHAVQTNSAKAVKALLDMGADTGLRNDEGETPSDLCNDKEIKELFNACDEEKSKQVAAVREAEEAQLKKEAAARIEGVWTPVSSEEIMYERDLPGNRYRLTDVFNITTKKVISITENLQTGQLTKETKTADKAMLDEARAQMEKIAPPVEAASPAETQKPRSKEKPVRSSFDKIQEVRL